ncbi:hypothetical protein R1flu_022214 [Riccia fluitans]|uniref:Secreted protein n=1 Tax=Riccia fluitans TaxID=41844 RepID=A0ABD1ZSR3_9MARC
MPSSVPLVPLLLASLASALHGITANKGSPGEGSASAMSLVLARILDRLIRSGCSVDVGSTSGLFEYAVAHVVSSSPHALFHEFLLNSFPVPSLPCLM